jgi:large subunit ribosomal protein L6
MVQGASVGFQRQLELQGVGYRAAVQGHNLDLQLGYSHPTKLPIPKGITVKVDKNIIVMEGADKQQLGQFAATVRALRPPEPYQGKGIRHAGEYVRRKAGKSAAKK